MVTFKEWERMLHLADKSGAIVCKTSTEARSLLQTLMKRGYRWNDGNVILADLYEPAEERTIFVITPNSGRVYPVKQDSYMDLRNSLYSLLEYEDLTFPQESPKKNTQKKEPAPISEAQVSKLELMEAIHQELKRDAKEFYCLLEIFGPEQVLKNLETELLKKKTASTKKEEENTPARYVLFNDFPFLFSSGFWRFPF